jgi:hypothetical protein
MSLETNSNRRRGALTVSEWAFAAESVTGALNQTLPAVPVPVLVMVSDSKSVTAPV